MNEFIKAAERKMKRPTKPLEKDIENSCVNYAKTLGCLALKLILLNIRGFPDRTILIPGRSVIFVEFKRDETCELSGSQLKYKRLLEGLGFDYFIVYSLEQFKELMEFYI